ncbi:Aspyridones efflux protein apdF, partial [Lachnellula arida]
MDEVEDQKPNASAHVEAVGEHHLGVGGHDPIVNEFPEGGFWGWLAVFGAATAVFAGGVEYSFGVFLTYYSTHFLSHHTASQISWIGSGTAFIHTVIGLLIGKLYDDGWFRHIIFFGSCLQILSVMLLSICTEYWQVWLCQGLGLGVAAGCIWQPSISIVSQYFERRRSLVMGTVICGSSLGGVVFPMIVNNVFEKVGFGWGVRINGFIMLFLLIIANLTMHPRLATRSLSGRLLVKREVLKPDLVRVDTDHTTTPQTIHKINYKHFFDASFCITTLGCFFIQLGTGMPYAYITAFATTQGNISPGLQFYLLPITFAGSFLGSPFWAGLADRLGVFNIVISTTLVSAGLQAAILGAKTDGPAVVISLLYGFMAAGFQSMNGPIYAVLSDTVLEIGHRMAIGFFVIGTATLISSPIQGALLGAFPPEYTFWKPIVFSVLCLVIGVSLLTVARILLSRSLRWDGREAGLNKKIFGIIKR